MPSGLNKHTQNTPYICSNRPHLCTTCRRCSPVTFDWYNTGVVCRLISSYRLFDYSCPAPLDTTIYRIIRYIQASLGWGGWLGFGYSFAACRPVTSEAATVASLKRKILSRFITNCAKFYRPGGRLRHKTSCTAHQLAGYYVFKTFRLILDQIFSRLLASNHNSRSVWSPKHGRKQAAGRLTSFWRHFVVEVNSRNLGGVHVCWGSYDGFNFAGWRGCCVLDERERDNLIQLRKIIGLKRGPLKIK